MILIMNMLNLYEKILIMYLINIESVWRNAKLVYEKYTKNKENRKRNTKKKEILKKQKKLWKKQEKINLHNGHKFNLHVKHL